MIFVLFNRVSGGLALIRDETLLLYCSDASMTSVEIPDSVKSIKSGMFTGCECIRSVVIPDSVETIGDMAFYGCKNLRSIKIPDSVKSIGEGAFEDCKNLDSATREKLRQLGYQNQF